MVPLPLLDTVKTLIILAATAHHVDPDRMLGVGRCESRYDPYVVNSIGARGVFQLMPGGELGTFYARGYTDWADPSQQANFVAERFSEPGGQRGWSQTTRCYGDGGLGERLLP